MNFSTLCIKVRYKIRQLIFIKKHKKEKEYWEKNCIKVNEIGDDYYVIRRPGKVGLFSIYITTIGHVKYARSKGLIPIIDLQNYSNNYMAIQHIGEYNPWEKMFIQPSGEILSDVEKRARVLYYCDFNAITERPNDETSFLYSLSNPNNEWRQIARNYMRVNPLVMEDSRKIYDEISNNKEKRVLGVLCRGTDYIKLKPHDHPIQPELSEIFDKVKEVLSLYHCERVFLATEDETIEKKFREHFGDIVFTIKEKKITYKGDGYLSDTIRLNSQDDMLQTGVNYLKKILVLSMCNCFVAGRTSGTVGVMLQDHDFDYVYFFDKGRYK